MKRRTLTYAGIGAAGVLLVGLLISNSVGQGDTTVANLAEKTHVHGMAVDPQDPSRLLLATHHGFHIVSPDGTVSPSSAALYGGVRSSGSVMARPSALPAVAEL